MIGQGLVQVGSVVTTMILARLLTPADFGLVAIAQTVMGAAALASFTGITASLVSWKGDPERLASTYFWLTSIVGIAVLGLTWILALPITRMLGQADAAPYLRVLAISFPLTLTALVPTALLQRQMRFSSLNSRLLLSSGAYFCTEIALAVRGWGAWSVVVGQVVGALVGLVGATSAARFRPRFTIDSGELRRDLPMLGGTSATRGLAYLQKNVDYWAVSRALGPAALGQYYVAYVLPNIFRLRLSEVFRTVMLPTLASSLDDGARIAQWRRAATLMLGVGIPVLVGISTLADPIVAVFFGSQWGAAVFPMQILALATIADLMIQAVSAMALAQRRVGALVMVMGVRAALTAGFVAIAIWLRPSLECVALAVVLAGVMTLGFQEYRVSRRLGVGFSSIARPVVTFAGLSAAMSIVVMWTSGNIWQGTTALVQLMLGTALGASVYVLLGLTIARSLTKTMLSDLVAMARGR